MSLMLLDKTDYVGDLAAGDGMRQLIAAARYLPKTRAFLESGTINTVEERDAILIEINDKPEFNHLRVMLENGEPPFIITDGVVDEPEKSEE